jgi:prefoldin subunit 4
MGYVNTSLERVSNPFITEDQQRINTFSKLNTRVRSLAEKMSTLKVSSGDFFGRFAQAVLTSNVQQDKEALDDLATELELADEDQLVLYAHLLETFLVVFFF